MIKLGIKVKNISQGYRLSHSRTCVLMVYCPQLYADDSGSCIRRGGRGRQTTHEFI